MSTVTETNKKPLLEVKGLKQYFPVSRKFTVKAVEDVSFYINPGETYGLVGESGSGKTLTALTIAGLLKKNAIVESGEILLKKTSLLELNTRQWQQIQGKQIGMIFQEPMTALNPTMKIGRQVGEGLKLHSDCSKEERRQKVLQALEEVELPDPEKIYRQYPHELSGGMRQRVMIASALICKPDLLIADEPTTALDVGTQESILNLLKKMNQRHQVGILFISHNLRVVKSLCENVLVLNNGEIIERGKAEMIFSEPIEAYTKELIAAIPTRTKQNAYYDLLMKKL